MIPSAAPPEPDAERPSEVAVPAWARVVGGAYLPVWVEPPRGGLALRLTDTGGHSHLAVMHLPSGYAAIASRVGGAPIVSNRRARAACRRAIDELLADGVPWDRPFDHEDQAWWRAGSLVARVQRELLPAVPEWRAWRCTRGIVHHRWHRCAEQAVRWARAGGARWWAVEHWPVPPGGPRRTGPQPLQAWARGEVPIPEGMAEMLWGAGGEEHRRSRGAGPSSLRAWADWPE